MLLRTQLKTHPAENPESLLVSHGTATPVVSEYFPFLLHQHAPELFSTLRSLLGKLPKSKGKTPTIIG